VGLKPGQIKKIERIYRRRIPSEKIITPELSRYLADISREIGRQIGILVDRRGYIQCVAVGNARQIFLPEWKRQRSAQERLSGLRYLHTHLCKEPLSEEDLTDLALLRFDILGAIGLDKEGLPQTLYLAHLIPDGSHARPWLLWDPLPLGRLDVDFHEMVWNLEKEFSRQTPSTAKALKEDRAILVGVSTGTVTEAEESLEELKELALSSGVSVLETVLQKRHPIDPQFVLGKGKLRDLVIRAHHIGAEIIIFDCNLTAAQMRSITNFTELKVLDRTQLILDIFAQRATSRDGKLQVELAQLRYRLPRLIRKNTALSRLTGGIGGRGPGETKLEIDRRRVRERIHRLEKEIESLREGRTLRRLQRMRSGIPLVSLIGYTNAGKSTLLNALTRSNVCTEAKMFTTLDPSTRRLRLPNQQESLLTDTVGFIRDLPPDLVAAFRATLEELEGADLLLHIIDSASPRCENQIAIVEKLLEELDLSHIPLLRVFNKIDRAKATTVKNICRRYDGVPVCALHPESLPVLRERIQQLLFRGNASVAKTNRLSQSPQPELPAWGFIQGKIHTGQ
jgi:GTP-binding protein HflX